ncbi:MAG: hypothetical protein A2W31_03455 [Planctomycetes bacterium RBG_16_64_10]|nr:MAG: hypothetical protein A2W31_03455 [Planctomycetes bacterium RBG_16_64_10]
MNAAWRAAARPWILFVSALSGASAADRPAEVRRVAERIDRGPGPKTNMRGACLRGTDLRGVDLSEVEGLTIHQLKRAILDRRTTLPRQLVR